MYVQCGINVGPNTDNLKLAAWYNLALELDEGPVIEVQSQRVGDVSVTAAKGPLKSLISVIETLGTEAVQAPQPVETAPVQAAPAAEQTQTAPAAEQTQTAPVSEPMQTAPASEQTQTAPTPARRGRPPGRKSTATAAEQTAALSATAQPAAPAEPAQPVEVPAPVPAQPAQPTQALPPGIAIPPGMTTTAATTQPQQPAMPKVPVGANGSNGVDGATTIEDLRACILQVNQRDQEMNRKPNTAFNLMRRKHWEDGTPHPAWFTADTVPADCYDRLIEELGLAATA